MPMLQIKNLKKIYDDGTESLKGINLDVEKGEFVAIIGTSGAGKSTLLRCINRLVEPTEGEIYFKGENVTKINNGRLKQIRREIGMIFQGFNLIPRVTVLQNVLNGRLGYTGTVRGCIGLFPGTDRDYAIKTLSRLGLDNQIYKRVDELSGGQQQRVGIARSIVQNPKLILADEPIASLDPVTSENIMEYIYKICCEDGIACLINLHQVDFAKKYATRVIGIKKGNKVFDGPTNTLTDDDIAYIYQ